MGFWKKVDAAMCNQERREALSTARRAKDPKTKATATRRAEVLRRQAERLRKAK